MTNQTLRFRQILKSSVAIAILACLTTPLAAEEREEAPSGDATAQSPAVIAVQSAPQVASIEERQSYALRLMTQVYNGTRDLSHTQMLGVGRIRKGNRSISRFDYGDGAVVIAPDVGQIAASRFMNVSGTEKQIVYNYDTKLIHGDPEIAAFHNSLVRPWLGNGPHLGQDASWVQNVPLSALGMPTVSGESIRIELSRTYFTHQGKPMVLVQYDIPAFSYDAGAGKMLVQWGRGIALTDPGFGMIYLNATLQRAVETRNGTPGKPYRFARNMVAANPDGSAMIDYREVEQLRGLIEPILGADAMMIVPVGSDDERADGRPLELGRRLDLLALSIGENGANEVPMAAGVQGASGRGNEVAGAIGARAMTNGGGVFVSSQGTRGRDLVAEEVTDQQAASGNAEDAGGRSDGGVDSLGARAMTDGAMPFGSSQDTSGRTVLADEAVDQQSSATGDPDFDLSPEMLERLEQSTQSGDLVSDAFDRVRGGGGDAAFGNQDPSTEGYAGPSTLDVVDGTGQVLKPVLGYADKANAITNGVLATETIRLTNLANDVGSKINAAGESYRQATVALKNSGAMKLTLMPGAELLLDTYNQTTGELGDLEQRINSLSSYLSDLTKQGAAIPPESIAETSKLVSQYNILYDKAEAQYRAFQGVSNKYVAVFDDTDPTTARLLKRVEERASDLYALEKVAVTLERDASALQKLARQLPVEQLQDVLKRFGDSPYGKVLDGVSHGMNGFTVGQSLYNIVDASSNDKSSGQLNLTRDHGLSSLVLDLTSLAGNAVSGNVSAFLSDATAITFGSVSDIILSGKALKDTHQLNARLLQQSREMDQRLSDMRHEKIANLGDFLDDVGTDLSALDQEIDDSVQRSKDLLEERRQARAELARQEQDEQDGQQLASAGREAENERRRTANDRLNNDLKHNYPTVDPSTIKVVKKDEGEYDGPPPSILPPATIAAIEREQRRQEAQDKLDAQYEADWNAKGLPPLDTFVNAEEREAAAQAWLDTRYEADRKAKGLPDLDTFATAEERAVASQARLDAEYEADRKAKGLPALDTFATAEERKAASQAWLEAQYEADRKARGIPDADRYANADERGAVEQAKLNAKYQAAWEERGLPYLDNFATAEERKEAAEAKLKEYQDKKFAEQKADEVAKAKQPGTYEFRTSKLETSELVVSEFGIEPITFEEVNFEIPVFDKDNDLFDEDGNLKKVGPDDFVMTPFDPPEASKFPPTDPDDLDGYPGTGEYPAFSFESMSGTVETKLDRWEEWLATQDVRKLTQLALAAGYPNLASALADAENIIRMSQDEGYRRWARTAPSCTGSNGCGPQYLERWAMKRSIVGLGDILAQSRGIFSSGGFTDIGVSGFNLMYVLRDFGIQDGDLIDVEISQFGRVIGQLKGHFLLTAGSPFNVRLRPGVAQMVISALNEGSASPNTAEVTIQNVVRGDGRQTYSLETGQTAVLRIEAGATGGSMQSSSNGGQGTSALSGTVTSAAGSRIGSPGVQGAPPERRPAPPSRPAAPHMRDPNGPRPDIR
ncbi:hypothetical protein [Altererythrobacter sp. ZODW24]|uniref:hypothetical protein n=1 Tax=Altererythrobacter sp. ZODW24 TaxID=2185142 RepID=UPI0013B47666|nr:hypothetical protein [Altererythrobacter sp. ZODW24]